MVTINMLLIISTTQELVSLPYTVQEERYGTYGGGSSPPSDSYNSASSDGPIMPPPYDSSGEFPPSKIPPATFPKPSVNNYDTSFQGSLLL